MDRITGQGSLSTSLVQASQAALLIHGHRAVAFALPVIRRLISLKSPRYAVSN